MCTAFVKKGKDIITGFNYDMNVGGMAYKPFVSGDKVFLGMCFPPEVVAAIPPSVRLECGVRLIQGVSAGGYVGGLLCNMDLDKFPRSVSDAVITIDQLTDDFVSEKMTVKWTIDLLEKKEVTNLPYDPADSFTPKPMALHSLFVDPDGDILFVEPGNGYTVIKENYFAVTNFPILELPLDLCDEKAGYYGVDRYRGALKALKESDDDFSVEDGLKLLNDVKQTGEWATRFSFVYSRNEDKVYYCYEGNFDDIHELKF